MNSVEATRSNVHGRPGSPAFAEALRTRLVGESALRGLGEPVVGPPEWTSRNTVVYRCRVGSARLIAKAQTTKPLAVLEAEYEMLQDMEREIVGVWGGVQLLVPHPVALFPDLGILLMEEGKGETLRTVVERGCKGPGAHLEAAIRGVGAAAGALRCFHQRFQRDTRSEGGSVQVRLYMDYSPKNLLVTESIHGTEVVLFDPPEEEQWGDPSEDIGAFCYDLARIRFLPKFIGESRVSALLDDMKSVFIAAYYKPMRGGELKRPLAQAYEAEYRRATQALRWYLRPWRYDSITRELLRLGYLGPLTLAYRSVGLRRSYNALQRLLGAEHP